MGLQTRNFTSGSRFEKALLRTCGLDFQLLLQKK